MFPSSLLQVVNQFHSWDKQRKQRKHSLPTATACFKLWDLYLCRAMRFEPLVTERMELKLLLVLLQFSFLVNVTLLLFHSCSGRTASNFIIFSIVAWRGSSFASFGPDWCETDKTKRSTEQIPCHVTRWTLQAGTLPLLRTVYNVRWASDVFINVRSDTTSIIDTIWFGASMWALILLNH